MKIRYIKNFLDFKAGETYDVTPESIAEYHVRVGIAKKVTSKDGTPDNEVKKSAPKSAPKNKK